MGHATNGIKVQDNLITNLELLLVETIQEKLCMPKIVNKVHVFVEIISK